MSTAASEPANSARLASRASGPVGGRRRLRVLVGVHDGVLSGVNTYVEQVAAAAADVVDEVTLLVAHDGVAAEVRRHLAGTGVAVASLRVPPTTPTQRRLERLSPGYAAHRLGAALAAARPTLGAEFDAVHLNHPHLAPTARSLARRVCVAAWFWPHSLSARFRGTWDHSGRQLPRSALLAVKSIAHHRNDTRGYHAAHVVVAPTRALTAQLRSLGIPAVHCTPPVRDLGEPTAAVPAAWHAVPHLLVCSGDLAHPRKNVRLALAAVAALGATGRRLQLELVGGNAKRLRNELSRLPGTVDVLLRGRIPAAAVQERMRQADLLLFPSRFEEWGYVAAEAALQGTAVVTLPVYPFTEMLESPYGSTAMGLSAAEYATAIARALDRAEPREEVSAAAQRRFGIASAGPVLAAIWAGEASPL